MVAKKTEPDWYLMTKSDLKALFPEFSIKNEWSGPFVKSIMAVKSN